MKAFALTAFLPIVASAVLKYDPSYNLARDTSLTLFACSDGPNGLITKTHVQTVPRLRAMLRTGVYIMAATTVAGWNSPNCGRCYRLRDPTNNKTISAIAVDYSSSYWVGGEDAFKALSSSGTLQEGKITVYPAEQARSKCFK